MIQAQLIAPTGQTIPAEQLRSTLAGALENTFSNQRVLVLIPDHTRSLPLPFLFRTLVELLHGTRQLDFMVALGTHPPLDADSMQRLVGISAQERRGKYAHIGLLNHAWNDPGALVTLGVMQQDQIKEIAGEHWHSSLPERVEIRLNRAALAYDHILILGPTFPHEVVGFSGGAKYLFPGISGPEMINATHWLGALEGVVGTIGIKETPVRTMIHQAAQSLPTPLTLIAMTVEKHAVSSMFIGDHISAWNAAADVSAQRHIHWCDKPFQRVLSCAPAMYDELWTAAKAMYKLEPAVAVGGEVIIYAPHLREVSQVHGSYIREVGYHTLPYILENWERLHHIPLGVLAHSTHLRGSGQMVNGVEKPNIKVTLASRVPAQECERLNLAYLDPQQVKIEEWVDREEEGILYVPTAGEILYRLKT